MEAALLKCFESYLVANSADAIGCICHEIEDLGDLADVTGDILSYYDSLGCTLSRELDYRKLLRVRNLVGLNFLLKHHMRYVVDSIMQFYGDISNVGKFSSALSYLLENGIFGQSGFVIGGRKIKGSAEIDPLNFFGEIESPLAQSGWKNPNYVQSMNNYMTRLCQLCAHISESNIDFGSTVSTAAVSEVIRGVYFFPCGYGRYDNHQPGEHINFTFENKVLAELGDLYRRKCSEMRTKSARKVAH